MIVGRMKIMALTIFNCPLIYAKLYRKYLALSEHKE